MSAAESHPSRTLPLEGIVVADFSRVLAGPYCTMMLADMGATVIKVESPGGDETRGWKPPHTEDGTSTYFASVNRNKSSIVLNLADEAELETAYALLDKADVFIENFKPGGLKKFGLDAETVSQRWPELVHASITGFGTEGGSHLPGYDMLIQAVSGLMSVTGQAEGEPQKAGVAIFDVVTGLQTAVGILAALRERDHSGLGQHVGLNLLSSALSGLVNQTGGYAAAGNVPTRMGNDHPSLFPYGPFACADRDLVIACGNDKQFGRLAACLDVPELAEDSRFTTMSERNANRTELRELLEAQLVRKDAAEWQAILQDAVIPCAPILSIGEGVDYADQLGLNPVVTTGNIQSIANPIGFSATPVQYRKAPTGIGQDQEDVMTWLGR